MYKVGSTKKFVKFLVTASAAKQSQRLSFNSMIVSPSAEELTMTRGIISLNPLHREVDLNQAIR